MRLNYLYPDAPMLALLGFDPGTLPKDQVVMALTIGYRGCPTEDQKHLLVEMSRDQATALGQALLDLAKFPHLDVKGSA